MSPASTIRVALAGNPNSGKTTIFNALTGARQHVGNYPGVTVERRGGSYQQGGHRYLVSDLPGTYSLASYSPEERIAQRELLDSNFDVVVAVVDSTNLRRSLVLVAQLVQIGVNPILCLNMSDEAAASGQQLDREQLAGLLGFPVVETVGHRRLGIDALRAAIAAAARSPARVSRPILGDAIERAVDVVTARLSSPRLAPLHRRWLATRLLVGDEDARAWLRAAGVSITAATEDAERECERLERDTGRDVPLQVMEGYHRWGDQILDAAMRRRSRADARARSDRIDRILVNRALGLPIFLVIMYGIFWLTFTVGEVPMGWIESAFDAAGRTVDGWWPAGSDSALRSLLVDGVIHGVGGVLVFLPNILLLFLGLAFLEDTGYMARAAFLMDRLMHRFGLHGRSFIPMMTGFGCSIPGIMATRTLENERDRLTTMLVLPLMSCGARLPIWMLLVPAFFAPAWRAPVLWSIYAIGVVLALLLALLIRRTVLRGQDAPFVMELPPYRVPTLRAITGRMVERSWLYLRKAGTVILTISIVMWCITSYPKKPNHAVDAAVAAGTIVVADDDEAAATVPAGVEVIDSDELAHRRAAEDLRYSIAGRMGGLLEPVIRPLGFDWKIGTGMIGAFAAKEVFVSQLGIVYSLGETDESSDGLRASLRRDHSPLTGFSLMLFLLIATPCMATFAITRRESGSWKWAALQLGGLTTIAYLLSLIVYQVGRLF